MDEIFLSDDESADLDAVWDRIGRGIVAEKSYEGHCGRPGHVGGSRPRTECGISVNENGESVLHGDPPTPEEISKATWYHASVASGISEFDPDMVQGDDPDAPYTGLWLSTEKMTSPAWVNPTTLYRVSVRPVAGSVLTREQAWAFARNLLVDSNGGRLPQDEVDRRIAASGARGFGDYTRREMLKSGYRYVVHGTSPKIDRALLERTGESPVVGVGWPNRRVVLDGAGGLDLYNGDQHITGYSDVEDFESSGESVLVVLDPRLARVEMEMPSPWRAASKAHFGHAGRPGGGSLPASATSEVRRAIGRLRREARPEENGGFEVSGVNARSHMPTEDDLVARAMHLMAGAFASVRGAAGSPDPVVHAEVAWSEGYDASLWGLMEVVDDAIERGGGHRVYPRKPDAGLRTVASAWLDAYARTVVGRLTAPALLNAAADGGDRGDAIRRVLDSVPQHFERVVRVLFRRLMLAGAMDVERAEKSYEGHCGRPGHVGGSRPRAECGIENADVQLSPSTGYREELHEWAKKKMAELRKAGTPDYSMPEELAMFGFPNRIAEESDAFLAMAEYVEKASSRESMIRVVASTDKWTTFWAGAADEWQAAALLGGNGVMSKAAREMVKAPKGGPLSEVDVDAFRARTAFVQAYVRRELADGGDSVTLYRGLSGAFAKKLMHSNVDGQASMKVYGLSSWLPSSHLAAEFATTGKSKRTISGAVVKATIPVRDVWLHRDLMPHGLIRFSDDRGEVVVLEREPDRQVEIVKYGTLNWKK